LEQLVADVGGDFVCGSDCVRIATVRWKRGQDDIICFTNVQYTCGSAMEPHFYLHIFPPAKTKFDQRSKRSRVLEGDIVKLFPSCVMCGIFVAEYLPAKYIPNILTRPPNVPICAKCRVDRNQADISFASYKKPKRSTIESLFVEPLLKAKKKTKKI
jgi:hypothetical protein